VFLVLKKKPELKKSIGRPGHRWDDTIERDRDEIIWSGLERIHLA
jgi:hypothetical protein